LVLELLCCHRRICFNAPFQDMPAHVHPDKLNGTVTVVLDGRPQTVWKTSLAAKYVPNLCFKWASILAKNAPKGALHGEMNPVWQTLLMVASCTVDLPTPPPTCPSTFTTGWEDATSEWARNGDTVTRINKKQKRPRGMPRKQRPDKGKGQTKAKRKAKAGAKKAAKGQTKAKRKAKVVAMQGHKK